MMTDMQHELRKIFEEPGWTNLAIVCEMGRKPWSICSGLATFNRERSGTDTSCFLIAIFLGLMGSSSCKPYRLSSHPTIALNLETAIGREKAVQSIYVHRKLLKLVVTLRVMRDFNNLLGA
jgi:hypothetical protein